jgi:hypothetical protein
MRTPDGDADTVSSPLMALAEDWITPALVEASS